MIEIVRISQDRFNFHSDNEEEVDRLKNCLKIWIDGAQFSDKFKKGWWDGYFRLYDKNNNFDSGIIDEVKFHLKNEKIKFDITNEDFRKTIVTDFILDKRLRPHQKEGVVSFFEENKGLMVVPTRGGKTFISGEIIRLVLDNDSNSNVCFFVDTTDLFDQTVDELSKFLKISESEIGKINSFGFDISKNITVAMIQTVTSIYSRKKPEATTLDKYFRDLKFLIVDEVQEYLGDNRMKLIKKCKRLHFLLGLSATPFKQKGSVVNNLKMKGYFGGVVYEVSKSRLQDEGYLALDKAILIAHEHNKERVSRFKDLKGTEKYQKYLTKLIHNNRDRNRILLDLIKLCKNNKWKTLVLFNSKEHGNLISEKSGETFLSGDTKSKDRDAGKDLFLKGRGKILLASNIFKKGITLPEAEILILADGGLEGSNIKQKIGRILGAVEGKTKAVVIDILDIEPEYFSEHSLNRLDIYDEEMGKGRIECYEDDDILSIEDSIKNWFDEK